MLNKRFAERSRMVIESILLTIGVGFLAVLGWYCVGDFVQGKWLLLARIASTVVCVSLECAVLLNILQDWSHKESRDDAS